MFDSSRYTLPEAFLDMAVDIIIFRYVCNRKYGFE